jgi:hypothetical protein
MIQNKKKTKRLYKLSVRVAKVFPQEIPLARNSLNTVSVRNQYAITSQFTARFE